MGIGKRMRDRRAELKMSSTELAEKIGVSKQTEMCIRDRGGNRQIAQSF